VAIPLLVPLGLAALGVAAYAATRPPSPPSAIPGVKAGGAVRVHATVSPSTANALAATAMSGQTPQQAVQTALTRELESTGAFSGTVLATEDPTDPSSWTFLTRWTGSAPSVPALPNVHVLAVEPTEEPPVTQVSTVTPNLDVGLTVDEVRAVQLALLKDSDPERLDGFASTFDGDFPVTASLLYTKATLEKAQRGLAPDASVAQAAMMSGRARRASGKLAFGRRGLGSRVGRVAMVGDVFDDIGDVASSALDGLKKATSDLGDAVSSAWDKYGGAIETLGNIAGSGIGGPQIWIAETAAKAGEALANGQNVGDVFGQQGIRFLVGLHETAPILEYVPGLGTGVGAALDAAAILGLCAAGQPCDPKAIGVDAIGDQIPGGPVAQQAFKTAATYGAAFMNGENVSEATLDAFREGLPDDNAKIAFDAGLALSRGQKLAEVGMSTAFRLLKSNSDAVADIVSDKGGELADAFAASVKKGIPLKTELVDRIVAPLQVIPYDKLKVMVPDGISRALADPALLQASVPWLSNALGYPDDPAGFAVAQAVLAAVEDKGGGVVLVDPDVSNRLIFRPPASNAAVKLAASTVKPLVNHIQDVSVLASTFRHLAVDAVKNPTDAAVTQVDAAKRAVARSNWVQWYEAADAAGILG
jgi:hypothetical protein